MLVASICFNKELDPTELYFPIHGNKKPLWLIDISQKTTFAKFLTLREICWDIFSKTSVVCSCKVHQYFILSRVGFVHAHVANKVDRTYVFVDAQLQ